jgi:transcriptional regulator with XRE-family HTH domain
MENSRYVTDMVTKIHKRGFRRLYLKEHRTAKGISAEAMAGRLGIERESVYRLEREPRRMNSEKQAAYAAALGLEPEELWRPPGRVSLDAMVANAPDDLRETVTAIVARLVSGRS